MLILGPLETYDLLLHMGKLPKYSKRSRISGELDRPGLLPLPQLVLDQDTLLGVPPKISQSVLEDLRSFGLLQERYTAFVANKEMRRPSSSLKCIVCSMNLPDNSFLHVKNDIYMLSPALCLLFLARMSSIDDEELIFAASQLCARYAYGLETDELVERVPHTNVNRIDSFISDFEAANEKRPNGLFRLRRILPYVMEEARSPREIAVGMIMNPHDRRSCFRTPMFEMNKRIALTYQEQMELGKGYLESDFVWECEKLILEYNGGVHADQREEDSVRTNILRDKGYEVEILTGRILDNFDSFLKFMRRLEEPLGCVVPRTANDLARFRELHSHVLQIANRSGRFSVQ